MNHRRVLTFTCAISLLAGLSACDRDRSAAGDRNIRKTGFPGMIAAGGGTSGDVLARTQRPVTDGSYAGGNPGMAGGAGGTTGGAATAGTVQETGKGPTSGVTPPGGTTPAGKPDGTGQ